MEAGGHLAVEPAGARRRSDLLRTSRRSCAAAPVAGTAGASPQLSAAALTCRRGSRPTTPPPASREALAERGNSRLPLPDGLPKGRRKARSLDYLKGLAAHPCMDVIGPTAPDRLASPRSGDPVLLLRQLRRSSSPRPRSPGSADQRVAPTRGLARPRTEWGPGNFRVCPCATSPQLAPRAAQDPGRTMRSAELDALLPETAGQAAARHSFRRACPAPSANGTSRTPHRPRPKEEWHTRLA